jgi:phage terminase large subunit-like protein
VLDDRSCRLAPQGWAKIALTVHDKYYVDLIVVEKNNGGDMVSAIIN